MNSRTISTTSISIEIVENMYNEAVVNDDAVCDYSDVDTGALSDLTYEDESDDETSETVEKSSKKTHFKTKTQPPQNKVDLSKQAANPKAREGKPKAKENLRTPRISHKESHRRLHIAKNSLKRVRTQLKGVKELNESLKQKNQVLQMKLDERAIAVKTLRDEQLRVFEKEKFDVEPDSSVTNAFTGIFGGTQSWAKHYAVEGWTEAGKEKFFEALSKFQEEVDGDFISRRLYHTIRLGKLPPRLVLNACVNKTLCREIFERPFAQLSADLSEQKNKEFEDALNWVMASTTESESIRSCNFIIRSRLTEIRTYRNEAQVASWSLTWDCTNPHTERSRNWLRERNRPSLANQTQETLQSNCDELCSRFCHATQTHELSEPRSLHRATSVRYRKSYAYLCYPCYAASPR